MASKVALRGCPCPGCGIYGGPGECISYGVVLDLDVASMVELESASASGLSMSGTRQMSVINSEM